MMTQPRLLCVLLILSSLACSSRRAEHAATPIAGAIHIQSFGGKADGTTDNTQAIAAAIEAASINGGVVQLSSDDVGINPSVDPNVPGVLPIFKDITVEDLHCESARTAIVLRGLAQSHVENVNLKNVSITATEGADVSFTRVKAVNPTVNVQAKAAP